MPLFLDLFMHL